MPRSQKRKNPDSEPTDVKETVMGAPNATKTTKHDSVNSDEAENAIAHWLMKSEPESRFEKGVDVKFGIEDLKACADQTACWDGVRNYQARNFMMKGMKLGHKVFFYHSNTKEPGIAGICQDVYLAFLDGNVDGVFIHRCSLTQARLFKTIMIEEDNPNFTGHIMIVRESYVDHTQFDSKDPHYDPKSSKENPKWFMVDVKFERMMKRYIPLSELKSWHLKHKMNGGPLRNVALFTKARLSVQPITSEEWDFIMSLENE